jgi:sugar transferase EpsL
MRVVKRAFDVTAAALALIVLAPAMALIALAVRVKLGSPILFQQMRPGFRERSFRILKFRTMREPSESEVRERSDGSRLTTFGAFLRRTSLDELPELWNVLVGEMSLVGPRPLLTQYLPHYTERERLRFAVRPGITGLAQVRGRNTTRWADRLELDAQYVESWSLGLDLRILGETLVAVARSHGVVEDARSIMRNLDEERVGGVT